ncbi:hypothetical protein Tco_1202924 [Tanacetum coccineum]
MYTRHERALPSGLHARLATSETQSLGIKWLDALSSLPVRAIGDCRTLDYLLERSHVALDSRVPLSLWEECLLSEATMRLWDLITHTLDIKFLSMSILGLHGKTVGSNDHVMYMEDELGARVHGVSELEIARLWSDVTTVESTPDLHVTLSLGVHLNGVLSGRETCETRGGVATTRARALDHQISTQIIVVTERHNSRIVDGGWRTRLVSDLRQYSGGVRERESRSFTLTGGDQDRLEPGVIDEHLYNWLELREYVLMGNGCESEIDREKEERLTSSLAIWVGQCCMSGGVFLSLQISQWGGLVSEEGAHVVGDGDIRVLTQREQTEISHTARRIVKSERSQVTWSCAGCWEGRDLLPRDREISHSGRDSSGQRSSTRRGKSKRHTHFSLVIDISSEELEDGGIVEKTLVMSVGDDFIGVGLYDNLSDERRILLHHNDDIDCVDNVDLSSRSSCYRAGLYYEVVIYRGFSKRRYMVWQFYTGYNTRLKREDACWIDRDELVGLGGESMVVPIGGTTLEIAQGDRRVTGEFYSGSQSVLKENFRCARKWCRIIEVEEVDLSMWYLICDEWGRHGLGIEMSAKRAGVVISYSLFCVKCEGTTSVESSTIGWDRVIVITFFTNSSREWTGQHHYDSGGEDTQLVRCGISEVVVWELNVGVGGEELDRDTQSYTEKKDECEFSLGDNVEETVIDRRDSVSHHVGSHTDYLSLIGVESRKRWRNRGGFGWVLGVSGVVGTGIEKSFTALRTHDADEESGQLCHLSPQLSQLLSTTQCYKIGGDELGALFQECDTTERDIRHTHVGHGSGTMRSIRESRGVYSLREGRNGAVELLRSVQDELLWAGEVTCTHIKQVEMESLMQGGWVTRRLSTQLLRGVDSMSLCISLVQDTY